MGFMILDEYENMNWYKPIDCERILIVRCLGLST